MNDSDCSLGYFCGSSVPGPDKNYFDNPGAGVPGEVVFLQRESLQFDGFSVFQKPSNFLSSLMTDLTIFVTVCQESQNDGYVIGKGVNDRLRDFGLHLRSSTRTVWLSYGTGENNPGFHSIVFFYNISVADGNCHSVSAVIDSSSNRALLYVDGVAARIHSPLPSLPNFRPNVRNVQQMILTVDCWFTSSVLYIDIFNLAKFGALVDCHRIHQVACGK